jgi:putative addiction module component (TIGR02574 family)
MASPFFDYKHLTAEERVQLAEELWESLADLDGALPLTRAQEQELDLRLEAYQRDGNPGTPWVEALRDIEERGR